MLYHNPLAIKIMDLTKENASLRAELKEYEDLAAEYGITGKQMLTLAKSQIATAKANCEMRDELSRYREAEAELREYVNTFRERLPFGVTLSITEILDRASAEAARKEQEDER